MLASDAAFLDALASCLGAGVSLPDALARLETAGAAASRWVQPVRAALDRAPGGPVESALAGAGAIDATERALLALAAIPDEVESVLHALAVRRRRRAALYGAIGRGLVGPLAIAALTVVLDPLPDLLGGGSYAWPVARGLFELGLATALVLVGVPAILRSPTLRPKALAACARLPGLAWLSARHAEAELVTVSAPFAGRSSAGLLAASTILGWSPLGSRVRGAAQGTEGAPEWALVRLAPHLSLETNLAVVSGIASGRLPARLAARGDELAAQLAANLRLALRVAAYALVVLLSLQSLVGMLSRALPGGALVPGGAATTEQKELEEIMKELEGSPPAPPRK